MISTHDHSLFYLSMSLGVGGVIMGRIQAGRQYVSGLPKENFLFAKIALDK